MQRALVASRTTLLELHYVGLPMLEPCSRFGFHPPPTLDQFSNLRVATVTNVHESAGRLPLLPVSLRTLTLHAGGGQAGRRVITESITQSISADHNVPAEGHGCTLPSSEDLRRVSYPLPLKSILSSLQQVSWPVENSKMSLVCFWTA